MPDAPLTRVSIFASDWAKILTLLASLIVALFWIGSWWGETQQELRSIGLAVQRLDTNISQFAQHEKEMEHTTMDHEYRIRSLEQKTPPGVPHEK